ncbi:PLP-dependent aminotransferase family protein [Sphingobacterium sp. LRF_L2]|uniref:aminotransferase-like domain-containing protein n=1 Tax=Sphingobacterium sp. LRF_L2 TaxID=3369421 RepID=UPI003F5FA2F2
MAKSAAIPFGNFIHIDRNALTPIYIQIANQLIKAIQRNLLPPNTKLPGTRSMSLLLDVHRNTIVASYDELTSQGWIIAKPNEGTFVATILPQKDINSSEQVQYPKKTGFSYKRSILLDIPPDRHNCEHVFNDGVPDIRLTQVSELSRLYSAVLKRKGNRKKMGYHNSEGSEYFKDQLSIYLRMSRGLSIASENLLITRSTEMSLFIISEILLSTNDIVVVGAPGYFSANMIFQKNGALIRTVPVDDQGINTDILRDICRTTKIRMLYVTPQQHYPTTVTLSAERRAALLLLAQEFNFVIVEDDYDYDFHYEKKTILPLVTADSTGMVIYVGSFGKSLAPGFRTGFIVAPADIMVEMRKQLGIIDRQGDILMEQALGEMIEEGGIDRHLKKSLKIYQERRDYMTTILHNEFASWSQVLVPSGGLAIWMPFHTAVNLSLLHQSCLKKNLFIPRNTLYQNQTITAMRIGFGHLDFTEMETSLVILKEAIDKIAR